MNLHKALCLSFFLVTGFLLNACKNNPSENESRTSQGKGGRVYGGVFRLSEAEYLKTLFPPTITDGFSYRIASQIYEGLFKFDPRTLKVIPSLAESYEIDSTGKIYTVYLKKDVYFHDSEAFSGGKGRELTAEDVSYCYRFLCSQTALNLNASLLVGILKGSQAYHQTASGKEIKEGLEGIKVLDNHTIQFTLEAPSSVFLYNLSRPGTLIYPKEAFEKYKDEIRIKPVGSGPFYLAQVDEGISMILKKHQRYHGTDSLGNKLPFLEAISVTFIKDKKNELFEFQKGNLDMLYRIPTEFILDVVEQMQQKPRVGEYDKYELQRSPEMITQFLCFQTQQGVFENLNVRKAFSFAIDREKILYDVLNNEGFAPGSHGIVPPVFPDYKLDLIKGYVFNADSARIYLKKAGYSSARPFPKVLLELNPEGTRNTFVAVEIQKQLKENLGINVEMNIVPLAQSVEDALTGKFELVRLAWLADYPNPENFLSQFYGKSVPTNASEKSYPNISRFRNPGFDSLYEKALTAKTVEESYRLFAQAENELMKEAPVIVLWYDEGYRLIQSYVKNFPNNPMQYRDFSEVWLEKSLPKQP
jgi:oligopeptide transport system substrate-binding protein